MCGNVWEWCEDWHGQYPSKHITDPHGPSFGKYRVIRGGSWYYAGGDVRSASRGMAFPDVHHYDVGFRVAMDP